MRLFVKIKTDRADPVALRSSAFIASKAGQGLGRCVSFTQSVASSWLESGVSIDPAGWPCHLDRVDAISRSESKLEPGIRGGLVTSPTRSPGNQATLPGLDDDPSPHPHCVALRSHLRLLPDGRVPVCQFNTETVGNLHASAFEDVWRSPSAESARGWVDACPGCWAECEVIPSAIYTGDIVRAAV